MKSLIRLMNRGATAALLAITAATAGAMLHPGQAKAQVAYGSYVGAGVGVGLTRASETADGGGLQGVITGRYRFLTMPISVRGQVFLFGGNFAFVPTVSYDVPLNWNTDIYLGAGAAFNGGGGDTSVVGDKTAFVLQPGVDYLFPNSNLVAFGNAVFAFDAYQDGNNMAVSVQGGLGYQF